MLKVFLVTFWLDQFVVGQSSIPQEVECQNDSLKHLVQFCFGLCTPVGPWMIWYQEGLADFVLSDFTETFHKRLNQKWICSQIYSSVWEKKKSLEFVMKRSGGHETCPPVGRPGPPPDHRGALSGDVAVKCENEKGRDRFRRICWRSCLLWTFLSSKVEESGSGPVYCNRLTKVCVDVLIDVFLRCAIFGSMIVKKYFISMWN